MISPDTVERIRALMVEASVFDEDIEESFILGGGPGGQKTNKTSSVVRLSHVPSGRKSAAQQKREKIRRQKRRRSRRQKQKMLDDKHAHSAVKALRRKVDPDA